MKLLLGSSFLHPRGGDTTLLLAEWAGWLARGVEVLPFAMRHPDNLAAPTEARFPSWHAPRESRSLGAKLLALVQSTWNREAARALDGLLRDTRPTAAHLHHLHRHLTPSILPILKAHGLRVVWTVHDYELSCPTGLRYRDGAPCDDCRGGHYAAAIAGRCKDGRLLPSAAVALEHAFHRYIDIQQYVDAFVAPSRAVAEALRADGIERVVHLPNLLPTGGIVSRPAADVVFAGRLTEEKGIYELLGLARALPHATAHVYGDGPLATALLSAGLANLHLLGSRPSEEVRGALAAAKLAIVPSRWPENQPYAVLEAQAAGAVVVASRVGGIPEMIDDDVDGVLVPPGDVGALVAAVSRLLGDEALRARMAAAARARIARERDAEEWFGAMRTVLGGG
ncbi:MAG: glycosyltransferase [Deltaproteobacteria bacterium]|nr:glycosyltransferase [Deltaproteobacteria bacterium]